MLNIGDYIVKAGEGVCRVDSTIMMKVPGDGPEVPYYLLVPVSDARIKVYLPVLEEYTEIRPVMSRSEAQIFVESVSRIEATEVRDEKQRESTYKDALRSCEPERIVGIIKHMSNRSLERQAQGKKNTAMDERYFAMAEKALYSEIGFALEKTDEEVRLLLNEVTAI